ncbi:MAG TPA: nitrogen regulation protein NR(II) [Burkholderiaceae bacterium]|nr:nitrogen regulation protein NR(II) [Burkholderiaceae bacterium]
MAASPINRRRNPQSIYAGLNLLASAVVVIDAEGRVVFLNEPAEQLFEISPRSAIGLHFSRMFSNGNQIDALLEEAANDRFGQKSQDIVLERPGRAAAMKLQTTAVALDGHTGGLLLEFRENDQRLRVDREARLLDSANANRELVRNLAHEIKNPLGGIRGAAQLLEGELQSPALREYTQVIVKEADRLQMLVDRLLAPHRHARRVVAVNIHEVCERVRSVLLAEFPRGLQLTRDYDASLPEFPGDREQLIQAVLNLARNAAQALQGRGEICLKTRVARQVTIARRRCRLALDLHVIDNGPGIPESIRDRIFFPLVSGRDGGSGLGLSLAQTFVQQHGGIIECDSKPGFTDFRILLPLS